MTNSEITMTGSFTISKVIVTLNVQHTFAGGLDVSLIAPDKSAVPLFTHDHDADEGANFVDTVLDQVCNM